MLVIDAQTGTILNAEHCYVVKDVPEQIAEGADSEIAEFAKFYGKSLSEIGQDTGWGDNKYRFTVSYSPNSLRDEADAMLDSEIYEHIDEPEDSGKCKSLLEWVKNEASDKELEEVAYWIMNADQVWNGFQNNVLESLYWYHQRKSQ